MKIFWRGAGAGALIGLVTSQLLGLALIGTDEIDGFASQDDLPFLYVVAAVIGVIVGLVLGALGLAVGAAVARSTSGGAARRRNRGALAAAGVSAVTPLVTVLPVVAGGLVAVVALGLLGGGAAWWLLPGVVDLQAERPGVAPALPARYGEAPVAPATVVTPTPKRVLISVVGAGIGAFVGTQFVMGFVTAAASLGRQTADVAAFVVLAALFVGLVALIWPRTASMG